MTGIGVLSFAIGILIGVIHALGIWWSANHHSVLSGFLGMARLLGVGIALVGVAFFGSILPAAGGWASGMVICIGALLVIRWRPCRRRMPQ